MEGGYPSQPTDGQPASYRLHDRYLLMLGARDGYPLLMSLFLLFTPAVAGMVVGFLLLDERDDGILTAHLVTPVPWTKYLAAGSVCRCYWAW